MRTRVWLYGLAVIVATAVAFYFHVWLVHTIDPYVTNIMEHGYNVTNQSRYGVLITTVAGITGILPVAGVLILFLAIEPKLPISNPVLQGILLAIFFLLMDGQLIRQPLMNWLIGNPPQVVLLELLKEWIPRFAMCILLVSIVRWRRLIPRRNEINAIGD